MDFGVQMVFQSYGYDENMTDHQVYEEEIALAILAEEIGFDKIWPVEHHFFDYSFCPDNTVFLANMAARTKTIGLATGAVIVPWNDPLRVAEKIALLDELSGGRAVFGMGRGLARREYEPFSIGMDESRERFDEAAAIILEGLETGFVEADGAHYKIPRAEIRPRPTRTFKDRTYCVSMSPDSVLAAARLGARQVLFSQNAWEQSVSMVDAYRDEYVKHHAGPPPPPITCDFVYCDEDRARAEELARTHITGYLSSVMGHYELAGEHFKDAKGYESYGQSVDLLKQVGLEDQAKAYLEVQIWGTPEMCLEKIANRKSIIGEFDLNCAFRFAGMPFEAAQRSMRTFATKVMPVLKAQEGAQAAQ